MPWVVPVGASGGVNAGFGGIADGSGLVRLGDTIASLEPHLFRLWRLASAVLDIDELLATVMAQGVDEAETHLNALVEEGLMIIETEHVEADVSDLAISVVGELLGNRGDTDSSFVAAGRNGDQVRLPVTSFEILLRSDGATTVGVICDRVGAVLEPDARPTLLEGVCDALPLLVRHDVVRLDRPRKDD